MEFFILTSEGLTPVPLVTSHTKAIFFDENREIFPFLFTERSKKCLIIYHKAIFEELP